MDSGAQTAEAPPPGIAPRMCVERTVFPAGVADQAARSGFPLTFLSVGNGRFLMERLPPFRLGYMINVL